MLPCTASDHWSIYSSIVSSDWQQLSRVSGPMLPYSYPEDQVEFEPVFFRMLNIYSSTGLQVLGNRNDFESKQSSSVIDYAYLAAPNSSLMKLTKS